jgi:glycosyltransferase involved in cell wall biosynthesis
MRLVVFGPGFPFRGGIARTTPELVRALRARGHQAVFFTPRRQYPRWLFPGATDHDPDGARELAGTRALLDPMAPWTWPAARRAALAERADAWLVPYWTWAWAGWWWWLLAARSRPPAVAVVHNPADHDALAIQRLAARRVLGSCQALFTHAETLAQQLRSRFPDRPVASHPIPPPDPLGLPDRQRAREYLDIDPQVRMALFLGLVRPYKGVDVLVAALHRLPPTSDWVLLVAGEPWGRLGAHLRRQVEKLGLERRVRLDLRWIPEREVAILLAAADLLVLPYRTGSQSAVAPLALGAGLPVVASRVGGLPEVVRHGVNGLLVEPGSVDDLAAALDGLDRERLTALGEGARRWARTVSWQSYSETLERLLAEIVTV